jgi:hypothetical protein
VAAAARVAVLVTALVVALALTSAAPARIVVQKGIAGVQLRMTRAQVQTRLGKPPKVRNGTNIFGRWTEFLYPRVRVTFQSGPLVTALRTTSARERTARGVGPGSTEAQVRARVAHVRCKTDGGFRHCWVGQFLPGKLVTDFHIRRGRVSAVVIGYVLD